MKKILIAVLAFVAFGNSQISTCQLSSTTTADNISYLPICRSGVTNKISATALIAGGGGATPANIHDSLVAHGVTATALPANKHVCTGAAGVFTTTNCQDTGSGFDSAAVESLIHDSLHTVSTKPLFGPTTRINPGNVSTVGTIASSGLVIDNFSGMGNLSQLCYGYTANGTSTYCTAYSGLVETSNVGQGKGRLVWGTRDVTTDAVATEAMTILPTRSLGVRTSTPLGVMTADPTSLGASVLGAFGYSGLNIDNRSDMGDASQIGFGYSASGANTWSTAYISLIETSNLGNGKGKLSFATRDVTTDDAPTERLSIASNGLVTVVGNAAVGGTSTHTGIAGFGISVPGTPLNANSSIETEKDAANNLTVISHGGTASLNFIRSQGTKASPTALTNGLIIASSSIQGDTAAGAFYGATKSYNRIVSQGSWSGSNTGYYQAFYNNDSATVTNSEAMRIANHNLLIGTTINGTERVRIKGNLLDSGNATVTGTFTMPAQSNGCATFSSGGLSSTGSACGGGGTVTSSTMTSGYAAFATGASGIATGVGLDFNVSTASTFTFGADVDVNGNLQGNTISTDGGAFTVDASGNAVLQNITSGAITEIQNHPLQASSTGQIQNAAYVGTPDSGIAMKDYVDDAIANGINGSGTITLTGCGSGTTATGYWSNIGKNINIQIPSMSCTSNATSMTVTGIPAAYWPVNATQTPVIFVQDATLNGFGNATFDDITGVLTFTHTIVNVISGAVTPSTTFTNTGTKGFTGFSFSAVAP